MPLPTTISEATRRLNPQLFGTTSQVKGVIADTVAAPRLRQNRGPKMNKTEAAFDAHLRATFAASQIEREGVTLLLANGVRYTADFAVFSPDRTLALYEVKGFMRDDAAVKIKVAASNFPTLSFFLATKRGAAWKIERVFP